MSKWRVTCVLEKVVEVEAETVDRAVDAGLIAVVEDRQGVIWRVIGVQPALEKPHP